MIGFGILTLVLIILAYFIFRPNPDTDYLTRFLHKTCFMVNGKKAKFDLKSLKIGDTTYPVTIPFSISNSIESPVSFMINNEGEYRLGLKDDPKNPEGDKIFKIDTISGPFIFTNC